MKPLPALAIFLALCSPALAQPKASPSTSKFVTEVARSDMFEIQSSELAAQKADDATKSFARQMVDDHGKTSAELKSLVNEGKVAATLPTEMSPGQQQKLAKLNRLDGAAFNRQYQRDQVSAHKTAVALFKRYASRGDNPDLKTWAGSTTPALAHHLEMAQMLGR